MILVGEARHRVVGLRLEPGAGDASLGRGGEHRQPRAGDQVVDERGEEHRLAGAGEAGDAEPQSRRRRNNRRVERATSAGLEDKIGEN